MARQGLLAVVAAVASALVADASRAALIVDPPQPITRQVTVQLIQTSLDNGTSPATVFGTASQRADIEAGLDQIWAQAGIDINVLPTITSYNNTFAYQGNAGGAVRPTGDLNTVFNNASSAHVLNGTSSTLNMILVNVVPGFAPQGESTAAGFARISGNGIMGFVGDNLLTSEDGRDIIAGVFGHEIGHNLGLSHTTNGIANLMSPGGSSEQLTSTQITTARSSNFALLYTPPASVMGDYNNNGVVDAADYLLWRKGGPLQNDPTTGVSSSDYTFWRSRFGSTSGAGSGAGVFGGSGGGVGAVPEAATIATLLTAVFCLLAGGRRKRQ